MKRLAMLTVLLLLSATMATAQMVPETFTYQGRLTDPGGSAINGVFDMVFRIYDDSIGGSITQTIPQPTVQVDDGLFQVVLTIPPPTPNALLGDSSTLSWFLEVEVEGEINTPRARITSSPYSVLSRQLAGDIFTSPGRLYMVPNGPPVTDCTYVPLELSVDDALRRIRLMGIDPAIDCTYVPLELRVDASATRLRLQPPDPITPTDSVEPAIAMSVDPTQALFRLWGISPTPFKSNRADHGDGHFSILSDNTITSLLLGHDGDGSEFPPSFRISSGIGTGLSLVGFNPQPEPPGRPLFEVNASPFDGFSIYGFNPQPEPPADEHHTLAVTGGLGDTGPGIFMFNPQPEPPGTPPYLLGMQTSPIGAMVELSSEPGLAKSAAPGGINTIGQTADTISARMILSNATTGGAVSDTMFVSMSSSRGYNEFHMHSNVSGATNDVIILMDDATARMGINTSTPTEELHVVGDICATGTIGACSDERYKTDVTTIKDAVRMIAQLRGVDFKWRVDEYPDQKFTRAQQVGFIAQEVKKVLPEVVSQGTDGYYSVDYSRLTPVLVEAVKEQQSEIDELKSRIAKLESLVTGGTKTVASK